MHADAVDDGESAGRVTTGGTGSILRAMLTDRRSRLPELTEDEAAAPST